MTLLDVLEDHMGFTVVDGGEEFEVLEFIEEWQAGAGADDRGPQVACLPGEDGSVRLLSLDTGGYPQEIVAVLVPAL